MEVYVITYQNKADGKRYPIRGGDNSRLYSFEESSEAYAAISSILKSIDHILLGSPQYATNWFGEQYLQSTSEISEEDKNFYTHMKKTIRIDLCNLSLV